MRGGVVVAIGGGGLERDAFLAHALEGGVPEALWVDATLLWAEHYSRPRDRIRGGRHVFGARALVWPGEVVHLASG